ncbi:hypothetical protein DFH07DRAFT_777841 [Mycena maculata]|uniref:Uncharacterized protein n=1 Tax=Mycena maculata TaxID=230809 RepID=A0AAD7IH02_9AGAR|nr:hypothetical protein DFH07DRAFT_777841 [Mycena maculata]
MVAEMSLVKYKISNTSGLRGVVGVRLVLNRVGLASGADNQRCSTIVRIRGGNVLKSFLGAAAMKMGVVGEKKQKKAASHATVDLSFRPQMASDQWPKQGSPAGCRISIDAPF